MVETLISQMGESSDILIRMTIHTQGQHTVYHHRYHIVWITKCRYRVLLQGNLRTRIYEMIAQVADELSVKIINGVLSSDHIHIFVSISPHMAAGEFVKLDNHVDAHRFKNLDNLSLE